VIKDFCD